MCDTIGLSQRRACRLTGLSLSTCRYEAQRPTAPNLTWSMDFVMDALAKRCSKSCMSFEEASPTKQQIVCCLSFGEKITKYDSLRQVICQYAERASEKLRKERQYCRNISSFPSLLKSLTMAMWPRRICLPRLRPSVTSLRPPRRLRRIAAVRRKSAMLSKRGLSMTLITPTWDLTGLSDESLCHPRRGNAICIPYVQNPLE